MSNEVTAAQESSPETSAPKNLGELPFAEYEKARRAGSTDSASEKSAQASEKDAEHKPAAESDPAENEAEIEDESEDEGSDEESDSKGTDKPKKKSGYQKRIDKLNARNTAAQREAEFWKAKALQGADESKTETKVDKAKAAASEGKPDPDAFDTHSEYVEALTDWKLEQRDKDREKKTSESQLKAEQKAVIDSHLQRVSSFKEKAQDFDEVIEGVDDIFPSPAIHDLILTSENGPQLMYELAKNRKEFERINALPPIAAAREMGKFESKLASSEEKPKKLITSAPKPIAPVGGSKGGAMAKAIDDPNISFTEYERARREQLKRRGA